MRKLLPFIVIMLLVIGPLYGGDEAKKVDKALLSSDEVKKADEAIPSSDKFIPVETMPEMIKKVAPEYPELAKKAGIEGYVFIQAYIDKTGAVKKAKVIKSSKKDNGFEEAAIKAAYLCLYQPAIQNGKPVGVWISYKVKFALDSEDKDK
ncbi:MAG: energy transducer TonB [candidate division Zixibacteria bacterium]|nr:energy transducer TonB [candidate division Zixibacteria bacterium]